MFKPILRRARRVVIADGNSGDSRCSTLSTCYDARGHALRKITGTVGGPFDLSFTYDAAERLTAITSNGTSVKSFTYDTGTPGSYPGKLVSAARHNYGLGTSNDRVVTENYWYAGKDGRISRKDTSITSGPTFSGSFTYNDLGAIATTTYPAYGTAPARTIQNTYENGFLTGVGPQPGTMTVTDITDTSSQEKPILGGPPNTATAFHIKGGVFTSPATVTIGGTSATVNSVSSNTISATTPATLAPGTANDIIVTSNGGSSTFSLGWFSDFTDVPQAASYHDYVVTLYNDSITAGCGGGNYCPDGTMSRYTLSVYIAVAMAGSGNVPTSGTGYNCVSSGGSSLAPDVDPASNYCKFANFLMANGVMPKSPDVVDSTNGCATGNFCGTATVTRADMAVYMARAIAGSDAQVPAKYSNAEAGRSYDIATPSTLVFTDVAANAQMGSVQYAKHVYYLWALGIVSGTSSTTYSPANNVTRGQMATFLAMGFHLPRRPATGTAFADRITYATNGTIASVVHGDGTTDVVERDPNSIARSAAIKTYGAPMAYSSGNYAYDGAGNIKTIGPDHFYYDLASRLTEGTASAGTKAQQLAYDAYGNITSRTNNGTNTGYTIQASTNRATAVGGTSWGYDGAGDVTSIGATTYAYDSLGMMTKLTTSFTSYYFYTPDDERIWSKTGSGSSWASTWTVRGTDAKVLREMTSTSTSNTGTDANYAWKKDYVYRDGLLLAAITGTDTLHFHLDHLGTPRLITYINGTATAERHDYYPFGEEVSLAGNEEMKFTGHERDGNSGLDYMHARFLNGITGRFLEPDRLSGIPEHPLSWNRYCFVRNNPEKLVEANGQYYVWAPGLSDGDKRFIQTALQQAIRHSGAREAFLRGATDVRPIYLGTATLNTRDEVRGARAAIQRRDFNMPKLDFGRTVPPGQVGGSIDNQITMLFDRNAIGEFSPYVPQHVSGDGGITAGHELYHLWKLLIDDFASFRDEKAAQSFGERSYASQADISPSEATAIFLYGFTDPVLSPLEGSLSPFFSADHFMVEGVQLSWQTK